MIYTLITFLLFGFPPVDSGSSVTSQKEICLSTNEKSLYRQINEVRNEKGLPNISLSQSLTIVAKMHVADLSENEPFDDKRCNPHSWSNQGTWKACCYQSNHSNPECMWKKPSEITDYEGDGYEIVAFWQAGEDPSQEIDHETALRMWLDSPGHSNVILNEISFSKVEWNAIGIAISGNYASVWFGVEKDSAPPPQFCSN
ncbi:CAP domain-containing protein [Cryomorphaceae bacterium 1068]|nr:CAP domain-containing protein [Cryomorphaceae bacterium 1068]